MRLTVSPYITAWFKMNPVRSAFRAARPRLWLWLRAAPGLAIAGDAVGGDHELAHDDGQRDPRFRRGQALAGPLVLADQPIVEVPKGC